MSNYKCELCGSKENLSYSYYLLCNNCATLLDSQIVWMIGNSGAGKHLLISF
jgi:ABC-type uncharacterized transport system YnjBCD ATPase subunit